MNSQLFGSFRKAITEDGALALYVVEAKDLLQFQMFRQKVMPPAMLHLGEASMGALLFYSFLQKDGEKLRVDLQWDVKGPFGKIYADCLGPGKVRSVCADPAVYVDQLRVSMGEGILGVRKHYSAGEPSTGFVSSTGWVLNDLGDYLANSEQKKCFFQSHIHFKWQENAPKDFPFVVTNAVAYLAHFIPPNEANRNLNVEKQMDDWKQLIDVMGPLGEWALPEKSDEITSQLLSYLSLGKAFKEVENYQLQYFCPCSDERAARSLALLTKRELKAFKDESKPNFEIRCEFCGEIYKIVKE